MKIMRNLKGIARPLSGCLLFVFVAMIFSLIFTLSIQFLTKHVDNTILVIVAVLITGVAIWMEQSQKKKAKKRSGNFLSILKGLKPIYSQEFESFFKLYQNDKKAFLRQESHSSLHSENLQPIELLAIFLEKKKQVLNIDWRGEENEGEIQEFVESLSQVTITWMKVDELRTSRRKKSIPDEKFILKLLKAIDKDLESLRHRLLFLNIDGDGYVVTLVDTETFQKTLERMPNEFYSADKL